MKREVKFLSNQICPGKCQPLQEMVNAIATLSVPTTFKALRQFLVIFSREFIESFAEKAKSLYDLLKTNEENSFGPWTEVQQKTFESLNKDLQIAPALATVKRQASFALQVHTSKNAISSVCFNYKEEIGEFWDTSLGF